MSICIGDVNQNGSVTVDDINAVKAHAGNAVTSSTFVYDLNHDGFIDSIDTAQDKAMHSQDASLFPDFAFTGHFYHARSGFYLAPYRPYNPTVGRWLSRDPIGEDGGLNLYAYISNNSVNFTDMLGLCKTIRLEVSFANRDRSVIRQAMGMIDALRKNLAKCKCPCITVEPVFNPLPGGTNYPGGVPQVLFGPTNPRQGGVTMPGVGSIISTTNPTSPNVLSHELGHQGGYNNPFWPGPELDPRSLLPNDQLTPMHSGDPNNIMYPIDYGTEGVDQFWCEAMDRLAK